MMLERTAKEPARYKLHIPPVDTKEISFVISSPTWFGLWRNKDFSPIGKFVCSLEGTNRAQLEQLRLRLLGSEIPESSRVEEEMWERLLAMPEPESTAAHAALKLLFKVGGLDDRKFVEEFPKIGPVPDVLRPQYHKLQQRFQKLKENATR